jgi:hypothetical protein
MVPVGVRVYHNLPSVDSGFNQRFFVCGAGFKSGVKADFTGRDQEIFNAKSGEACNGGVGGYDSVM